MLTRLLKGANIAIIVLMFVSVSCKKGETPNPSHPTTTNTKTDTTTHIYIAGSTGTAVLFSAALWTDGVLKDLSPDPTSNSTAFCVAVKDTDVYAGGFAAGSGISSRATYWKNGSPTFFNTGIYNAGSITSIIFNGADFYATGSEITSVSNANIASYWKNSNQILLSNSSVNSSSSGIVANGNDVYICGGYTDNAYNNYPAYWKNGSIQNLPIDVVGNDANNRSNTSYANGIALLGTDIYACGYTIAANGNQIATYWKNGIEVKLTDGSNNAVVKCIGILGTDVYMGGFIENSNNKTVAVYWKNGIAINLTDGSTNAVINAMCVHKNDVYFAGYNSDALDNILTPVYWKNGNIHSLPGVSTTSIAYGITVTGGQ
jgi:hypothetical protein